MSLVADEIVCLANGSLSQVEIWHALLGLEGIESRVVGDNLSTGLGSAIPGSVEIWVHQGDAKVAEALIEGK